MKTINQKFAALALLGVAVVEDADQPGMWIWISTTAACEASLHSREDAINEAFEACLLGLLTDLSNSADDTGCEDCYVVDDTVVDRARLVMQAIGAYPVVTEVKLVSADDVEKLAAASTEAREVLRSFGCELKVMEMLDSAIHAVQPAD